MGRGKRNQSGRPAPPDRVISLSEDGAVRGRLMPANLVKSFAENPLLRPAVAADPPRGSGAGSLVGKSYVITGKIPNFTRTEAMGVLEELGAVVYDDAKHIKPGLSALIEGGVPASKRAKGGTKKQQAADLHGIPVLDEHDFYQLIGRTTP